MFAIEKHYRAKHIVERTGLSDRTVRRLLKEEPGVRVLPGVAVSRHTRRKYETVLVPESVLQRILTRMERVDQDFVTSSSRS